MGSIEEKMKLLNKKINLPEIGTFSFGTIILVGTWFFLFTAIAGITEGLLVPWDTTPIRPPIGDWQRTINDFFEAGIGAVLPSIIFVYGSLGIFLWRLRKEIQKDQLPYLFAFSNFVFFLVLVFSVIVGWKIPKLWLSDELFLENGFHKTWVSILIVFTGYISLFWVQTKVSLKNNKRYFK